MNSKTVHNQQDLEQLMKELIHGGLKLEEIKVVTLALPNGMGYYHPAYLVMWID